MDIFRYDKLRRLSHIILILLTLQDKKLFCLILHINQEWHLYFFTQRRVSTQSVFWWQRRGRYSRILCVVTAGQLRVGGRIHKTLWTHLRRLWGWSEAVCEGLCQMVFVFPQQINGWWLNYLNNVSFFCGTLNQWYLFCPFLKWLDLWPSPLHFCRGKLKLS